MQTAALDARLMTQYKTQYARYTTTMRDMFFLFDVFHTQTLSLRHPAGAALRCRACPMSDVGRGRRAVVTKELLIGIKGIHSKLGRVFDLN